MIASTPPARFGPIRNRWRELSYGTRDGAFAFLLTVITQIELLTSTSIEGSLIVQSASFAAMTLSVAWRRSMPLLAAAMVSVGLTVQTLAGEAPIAGGFIALLVVMYSVASYSALRPALVGGAMILISAFIYPVVGDVVFADEVVNAFLLVGPWAFGRSIRYRQARAVEAEAEATRLAVERDRDVEKAITAERGRIARDMHDVVAHGVSMMVLQTGAARHVVRSDPARSQELLLNVEDSGRQALDEMRLMLEVLNAPAADVTEAGTTLTVDSISDLADRASGSDASVTFEIVGTRTFLPPGLESSFYRIAQEAITNAVRHGNARSIGIELTFRDDLVVLSITDDGGPEPAKPRMETASGGNGIIGMRARAELFGGTLTSGPRTDTRGWVVTAAVPVAGPA
jgi:signal transduction histidine kinase